MSFILAEAGLLTHHETCISWVCRDAERNARDILQITSARKADDSPSKALLQQKNLAIEMDRRVNAALLPMEQHIGKPVSI